MIDSPALSLSGNGNRWRASKSTLLLLANQLTSRLSMPSASASGGRRLLPGNKNSPLSLPVQISRQYWMGTRAKLILNQGLRTFWGQRLWLRKVCLLLQTYMPCQTWQIPTSHNWLWAHWVSFTKFLAELLTDNFLQTTAIFDVLKILCAQFRIQFL